MISGFSDAGYLIPFSFALAAAYLGKGLTRIGNIAAHVPAEREVNHLIGGRRFRKRLLLR